ncbi:polysaccharide deacetylase family protein [Aquipuribacter nitratireducens]|uniref:Polysaccharide deacetylase family protein n=1 Tax=Aquipuribacter nitratireducens TaxID=650104 RepID=A0ABW0GMM5_9MICO
MSPQPPSSWPSGSRGALVVNIMYEQWEPGVAPGLGPMGNPLPAGALDHQARGWADYGWRTGVPAVLDLLRRLDVPATFYVSGCLTETRPGTVEAVAAAGHEVAAHAWAQNRIPALLGRDAEAEEVERCADALGRLVGRRPRGWISPRCTPSALTAELLAAAGYDWFGDVFDADLPYRLDTPAGPITALPFGLETNDLPMTVRYGRPVSDLARSFEYEARAIVGTDRLAYVDVTLHAHVGCRPAGLLALSEIVSTARAAGMWCATRSQVADFVVGDRRGAQPGT